MLEMLDFLFIQLLERYTVARLFVLCKPKKAHFCYLSLTVQETLLDFLFGFVIFIIFSRCPDVEIAH